MSVRLWNQSSPAAPLGRLDQLRLTLDALGVRVRDAVALSVGRTAAGLVRDAVRAALDGLVLSRLGSRRAWLDRQDADTEDPAEMPLLDEEDGMGAEHPDQPGPCASVPWLPAAVAAGIRAAVWWRRGRDGVPRSLRSAAGIGLLAACASYACGPLAVACLGLAESAVQAADLARVLRGD